MERNYTTEPCHEYDFSDSNNQSLSGEASSDVECGDFQNFKGIYYENESEKYICPETGAHFNFKPLCEILEHIRRKRGDPECR